MKQTCNAVNPYPANIFFFLKTSPAYYVCCIFLNAFQNTYIMEANPMNPDQTAPQGAVWSGSLLFAI